MVAIPVDENKKQNDADDDAKMSTFSFDPFDNDQDERR